MTASGDDIRQQNVFELDDAVFKGELALLHALDQHLVGDSGRHQSGDSGIEVGVFLALCGELEPERRFLFLGQRQHRHLAGQAEDISASGTATAKHLHPVFHLSVRWSTAGEFFVTIDSSERWKGVVMTTEGHIAALERRHRELDRQIQEELSHASRDDLVIAALKRKKLELKDELSRERSHAA
jgi:hypothetical protein